MPGRFGAGVKDQRPLSERPDVLTFTGELLASPLTVLGRVSATLYASSSAPDTDFVVRLVDVHPDGFMQNLCDGVVRARYRHSVHEPAFIEPGEVCELKIDLWSVAHVFQPGHRVAVQVTSSSFPRWDRNLNTREQPGTGAQAEVAHQTLHHDAARPSAIHLPVAAAS
jgi:putative CocE/NonD family hydrolase